MARIARWIERGLILGGAALLAVWGLALVHHGLLASWDRAAFGDPRPPGEEARQRPKAHTSRADPRESAPQVIADTREWSAARIAAYFAQAVPLDAERLGLLEIPAIDLAVVVLEGTDEWTLNRGVGRIEGTAAPGVAGNAGIAGHRDGFFRGLERVKEGDVIRVTRPGGGLASAYRIEWIRIVRPEEVWVLEPTEQPSLTLVTCHPFRFVGHAPDRYVVRAVALQSIASRS